MAARFSPQCTAARFRGSAQALPLTCHQRSCTLKTRHLPSLANPSDLRPAVDIAVQQAEAALRDVQRALKRTRKSEGRDARAIHRLRVSARRTLAILTLVEPVLDPRQFVKTCRLLRRIARTARPVRDLDAVLHHIEDWPASKPLEQWTRSLKKDRAREADSLCAAIEGWLAANKVQRRARRLVRHSKCLAAETAPRSGEPPFPVWASQRWLVWVEEQCQHAPSVDDSHVLHAFRLSGKQIRYAMEYLSGMFAKPYRNQLQTRLRKQQEQLGEINDLSALVAKLKLNAEAAECLSTAAVWESHLRASQKKLQQLRHRAAKRLTPESLLEFRNLCRESLRESLGALP